MANRTYRCGSSQSVYYAPPRAVPPKPDRRSARLLTALHLPAAPPALGGYRVVATLVRGGTAVVCLGATRREALAGARARAGQLPRRAVVLRLEEWTGGICSGRWRVADCRPGELPSLRARAGRRQRQAGDWE